MIKFMIKYGEYDHLKQIVDGSFRMTPSQTYIGMEKEQHNKGQGDLLEGKLRIHIEGGKAYDPITNKFLGELPKGTGTINIQNVSDMPIFCLSWYDENYVLSDSFIKLTDVEITRVHSDFPKATHALVIFEPNKFISDVTSIDGHCFANDIIHYFNYDINDLRMFSFLTTGDENERVKKGTMTYDNRYRHLLCKDEYFKIQREYRFICLDELIKAPVCYHLHNFSSRYVIIPIDELKQKVSYQ